MKLQTSLWGALLKAPECSWYKKLGQFKELPEQDNSLGEKSSLELLVQVPVDTHPQHTKQHIGSAGQGDTKKSHLTILAPHQLQVDSAVAFSKRQVRNSDSRVVFFASSVPRAQRGPRETGCAEG